MNVEIIDYQLNYCFSYFRSVSKMQFIRIDSEKILVE